MFTDRGGEPAITDDIDHLGNRRVRSVGELLANQFNIGLGAHGADHPRAHVAPGPGSDHADRPRELAHDLGGDSELLRQQPAVAVHGSDQPARRVDEQAPPVGARARRPDPRSRRLRGARRPLHALRAHVPDRDAGRPEHRPHLVALDLRQGERVRLPRDAVLPRAERARRPQEAGVPRRGRRGSLVHRAVEHAVRQAHGRDHGDDAHGSLARRVPDRGRDARGLHGRVADPARVAGGGAESRSSSTTTPTAR